MIKNEQKITKEFCVGRTLVFYPQTAIEAAAIQRSIFLMGYKWAGGKQEAQLVTECVNTGMALINGVLYWNPTGSILEVGLLCSSAQLSASYDKNDIQSLSGDELTREVFNRLSKRLDGIDAKLNELTQEIMPKKLDKSGSERSLSMPKDS